jgi:hypothetical protein
MRMKPHLVDLEALSFWEDTESKGACKHRKVDLSASDSRASVSATTDR